MIDFSAAAAAAAAAAVSSSSQSSASALATQLSANSATLRDSSSSSVSSNLNPNQQAQSSSSPSTMLNYRQQQQSGGQSLSSSNNSNNSNTSLMHAFGNIGSGLTGGGGGGSGGSSSGVPPPTLDMNEFPSLGGTVSINTFPQSSSIGRPAYVGMVKDNVTNQSGSNEFNIQIEDFPALPGASPGTVAAAVAAAASFQFQNNSSAGNNSSQQDGASNQQQQDHHLHHNNNDPTNNPRSTPTASQIVAQHQLHHQQQQQQQQSSFATAASTLQSSLFLSLPPNNNNTSQNISSKSSTASTTGTISGAVNNANGNSNSNSNNANSNSNVNTNTNNKKTTMHVTKDGHVMNIPAGMINDQYGIAGLLSLLQQSNSYPNLYALTIGHDITKLNMNLNSKERLYHTFPGPWNDKPLKPYEIDFAVPQEYQIFNAIKEKLAPIKLANYNEDLLFYLFYCFAGEQMQVLVGQELFTRDWRYHKDEGIWITRNKVLEQSSNFERGSYYYFDTKTWSKQQKDMFIEYDRLDGPNLP